MLRFNLGLCVAVNAVLLSAALPTQAAVTYSEDFEGAASYPTGLADFSFNGIAPANNSVAVDTGANLGTRVALLPPNFAHWAKPLAGLADDLITFQYDGYVTGLGIGGEGMVGLQDSNYSTQTDAERGVFVGIAATEWRIHMSGLTQASNRIPITVGGSPGVGAKFTGATNVAVTVKTVIDRLAGTNGEISVDILKRSDLTSLNPTFTIPLTAFEQGNIANLDWLVLHWNDDWSASDQMVEIDNVRVVSGIDAPPPTRSWAADVSGTWNDSGKWTPMGIPNASNEIAGLGSIITGTQTISVNTAATVNAIIFGDTNSGTAQNPYIVNGSDTLTLVPDAGTSPAIYVLEGSHQFQTVALNFTDSAEVAVAAGSTIAFDNVVGLNGFILTKIGPGTMNINGQIDTGGSGSIVVTKGVVGGTGTVTGDLTNSSGTVGPGISSGANTGKLSVTGDYLQILGGSLLIEIDGTMAETEYDVLDVTGALTINGGSLDIVLGFIPEAGDVFDILDFGSISFAGDPVNFDLATLAPGLIWDSSQLSVNGSLSVIEILPTLEWSSSVSGDWNSTSNWTAIIGSSTIPDSNLDFAIFGNAIPGPRTVFTDSAVTVKHITFGDTNASSVQQSYNIAGSGSVTIDSDNNISTVSVLEGSHEFQVVVNLSNATTVDVAASSSLSFNNALNLGGNTLTKTGDGNMTINNDLNTGGGAVVASAGVVGGGGTIGGNLTVNGTGIVAPGNSAGTLTVDGNYTQTSGALAIEINGSAAGEFDVLAVTGDLTVTGGDLNVTFAALPGKFQILDVTGSSSAAFDSVNNTGVLNVLFDDSLLDSTGELIVNSAELGDMDGDLMVTLADAALFVQALVDQVSYDANNFFVVSADFNGDVDGSGTFDLGDLRAFSVLLGGPSSASAVPEPSSILLFAIALSTVVLRRRRLSQGEHCDVPAASVLRF